jgi:hypothetical protein
MALPAQAHDTGIPHPHPAEEAAAALLLLGGLSLLVGVGAYYVAMRRMIQRNADKQREEIGR